VVYLDRAGAAEVLLRPPRREEVDAAVLLLIRLVRDEFPASRVREVVETWGPVWAREDKRLLLALDKVQDYAERLPNAWMADPRMDSR
jgi:hypothetical protein